MNQGKICVSVCAKTAEEMFEQVRRCEKVADVIEVRMDCLELADLGNLFSSLNSRKQLLVTLRPRNQGGNADYDLQARISVWTSYAMRLKSSESQIWVDQELDLAEYSEFLRWTEDGVVVRSFHDFAGVPDDINGIFKDLASRGEIAKMAFQTNDVTESISAWKLLKKARTANIKIIPIAMGEAGKWTRILGVAHGAFMTYASLDASRETAPGQISAADMLDVYRVKELDENTGVYGIIAGDTSYSVSPFMHNAAFKAKEMNSVFVPLQVADLDAFMQRMVKPETREIELNFKGFSVTNPHKQSIIKHLDVIDETAQKIGAVNTVKIDDGKIHGYNTDAPGFLGPLKEVFGDLKNANVAVIGAGGASRACIYALQQEDAGITLFARDPHRAKTLADEFGIVAHQLATDHKPLATVFDIIVNATPVGTMGENEEKTVATAEQLKGVKLVYDLIYNPAETRLMKEAKLAGAKTIGGLDMLIAQGAKQFEIWTGQEAPIAEIAAAVKKRLNL